MERDPARQGWDGEKEASCVPVSSHSMCQSSVPSPGAPRTPSHCVTGTRRFRAESPNGVPATRLAPSLCSRPWAFTHAAPQTQLTHENISLKGLRCALPPQLYWGLSVSHRLSSLSLAPPAQLHSLLRKGSDLAQTPPPPGCPPGAPTKVQPSLLPVTLQASPLKKPFPFPVFLHRI